MPHEPPPERPRWTPTLPAVWSLLYFAAPALYWSVVVVAAMAATDPGVAAGLVYFYVAFLSALILLRLANARGIPVGRFGIKSRPTLRDVAFGVGFFLVVGSLWPPFMRGVEALGGTMFWEGFGEGSTTMPPAAYALFLVGALVAAPIGEEIWFRGYAFALLRQHGLATGTTNLLVSAAFGLLHLYGGPGFAAYIFVWSLGAGLLYIRTESLWATWIMHVLNNVFAHVVVPLIFAD